MLVIEAIYDTNVDLEREERFDRVMLNTYIIDHVIKAMSPGYR